MTATVQTTRPIDIPQGFRLVDDTIKRRMIMSIEGDWGTGKTDLALTAPGPIAFFKFDLNSDVTLAKWAKKRVIYKREYEIPKSSEKDSQTRAEAMMNQFRTDYQWAVSSPKIRTVIWDTATELWEGVRLAAFGRLTNVMPHHYVQTNNDFRGLIKLAFDSDTNLIMIHRLKDAWENYTGNDGQQKGRRTGKKERAGFGDIGFACQVMVQTTFEVADQESPFKMKVLKCTQTPQLTDMVYAQVGDLRMNSFPMLAADVFPGTDIEKDWQ